jgi:hypothetical protein
MTCAFLRGAALAARDFVFSWRRGGDSKLYLMFAANGKIISALAEGEGNDISPALSWWMGG